MLTEPAALSALYRLTGSSAAVDALVRRFATWQDLAEATPHTLVAHVGAWAGSLRVPAHCPPMPPPGAGVRVLTRYHQTGYPSALLRLPVPPSMLYVRGQIPVGCLIAVGGAQYPSADAIERARAVAERAALRGGTIVAAVDCGCGRAAMEAALSCGGKVVAIASGPIGVISRAEGMFQTALSLGGGVLSEHGPGASWSDMNVLRASELAAAMGDLVAVAEFGIHPAGGLGFVQSAARAGRPMLSFATISCDRPLSSSSLLSRGGRICDTFGQLDLPQELASIGLLASRAVKGHPLADYVVANSDDLTMVIQAYADNDSWPSNGGAA